MVSSIEIHNKIRDLDERIAKATGEFNAAEGDAKDALRDAICGYKGEQKALNDQLGDVLAAEDEVRRGGGVPLTAEMPKAKSPADAAAAFLGTRDEFDRRGSIMDVLGKMVALNDVTDATHQLGLATPTQTSYDLPSNVIELPMGVLDTLSKGTTDANLVYKVPGAFTNGAALWQPGKVKAESDEHWDEKTMNLFTVAHWVAISKHAANHYGQLQSLITNDLMYGLRVKEHAYALNLDDGDGKHGILKDPDIQKYTAKKGEKFYDSARRMKTAAWMASGFQPNYVAVHPYVMEQLDLEKSSDGWYLRLNSDGKVWGIPVVEDVNLFETTGESTSAKTTYGALMYNSMCATWYTSETDALSVGLVNDQFIRNEYTLLAEGEHGITVQRPKAFVYLKDAVSAGA
ncbi:phage major capsid protein [uncultured Parolsenella sp.]|uniref:phage major capsid protein n=1 Tax=uncultured Parolsenella sp. TaxID=2083008 RepID=UPI0027D99D64|nr:phage major capsid protein [uncultured Parolsenella sp.]